MLQHYIQKTSYVEKLLVFKCEVAAMCKGSCGCPLLLVEGHASAQITRDKCVAQAFHGPLIDTWCPRPVAA